jgi:hypothetical protein
VRLRLFGSHHAVGDDFFLADDDLRAGRRRERGLDPRDLVIFEGALRLLSADPELVEMRGQIFELETEFFRQHANSCLRHSSS